MESTAIFLDPDPDGSAAPRCTLASVRRRAWAKSRDSTWQETQKVQTFESQQKSPHEVPPDCSESNRAPKKTSEEPGPNKITCWLDQCRTPLAVSLDDQSAPACKGAARNGCSFEDDLSLGAEADHLQSIDKKTGTRGGLAADQKRGQYKEKGRSMNSTGSGKSSTVSSVSELLDLYEEDPEEILLNLGFGRDEPDMSSKIPSRFFSSSSAARGIDIKVYLGAQLQRMELENPNYALTSRFRQIEVLTTVANQFIQLYGHVSGQPVQNVGGGGGGGGRDQGGEVVKEPGAPSLFQRKKSAQNVADRLKKSLSKHNLLTASPGRPADGAPPAPAEAPDVADGDARPADKHVRKKDGCSLATVTEEGEKERRAHPRQNGGEPESDGPSADDPRAPEKALAPTLLAQLRTENADSFDMEEIQSIEGEALLSGTSRSSDLLRTTSQQSDSSGFAEETSSPDAAGNLKVQESSDSCDSETTVTSHPSQDVTTPVAPKQFDLPDVRTEESPPPAAWAGTAAQETESSRKREDDGEGHEESEPVPQYKAHQLPKNIAAGHDAPEPQQDPKQEDARASQDDSQKDPPPSEPLDSPPSDPPPSDPPPSDPPPSDPPPSDPPPSDQPPSDVPPSDVPPSDPPPSDSPPSDPPPSDQPPSDPPPSDVPPSDPPPSDPPPSDPPPSDPPPSDPPPSDPPPSDPLPSDPPPSDPPPSELSQSLSLGPAPSAHASSLQAAAARAHPFRLPASDSPVLSALSRVKQRLGEAGPRSSRRCPRSGLPLQRSSSLPSSLPSPTRVVSSVKVQLGPDRAFSSQPRYAFRYVREPDDEPERADSPTCISTLVIQNAATSDERDATAAPRPFDRLSRLLGCASPPAEVPWISQSVPNLSSAREPLGHRRQGGTPLPGRDIFLSPNPSPRPQTPLSAPSFNPSLLYSTPPHPYASLPNILQPYSNHFTFTPPPLATPPHYASLWNLPLGTPPVHPYHAGTYHMAHPFVAPPYLGYHGYDPGTFPPLAPDPAAHWGGGLPGQAQCPGPHHGIGNNSNPNLGQSPHPGVGQGYGPYPGAVNGPHLGHGLAHSPYLGVGPGTYPGLGPGLSPGHGLHSCSSLGSGQVLSGTEMQLRRVLHDIRGTVHNLNQQRVNASDVRPEDPRRKDLDELRQKRRSLAAFRTQMLQLELSLVRQQALVYNHLSPADRLEVEQLESLRSAVRDELLALEQQLEDKLMELTQDAGPPKGFGVGSDEASASSALRAVEPVSDLLREQFLLQSELSDDRHAASSGPPLGPGPGAGGPAVYRASINITPVPPPRPDRRREEEAPGAGRGHGDALRLLIAEVGESVKREEILKEPSAPDGAPRL
ncbi:protein ITPRID2 isoform X2 [Hippocampus zosterae]|uniref:protein ITPRID2 isoform X2 n=1 Tax=Hippocampus zosterae TaxID=109293 RepID=UPI00223DA4EB|nr:protein ITPRID2 isoform X2 [Hippocampus zosterae]